MGEGGLAGAGRAADDDKDRFSAHHLVIAVLVTWWLIASRACWTSRREQMRIHRLPSAPWCRAPSGNETCGWGRRVRPGATWTAARPPDAFRRDRSAARIARRSGTADSAGRAVVARPLHRRPLTRHDHTA